jgi:hypothetical protein
VLFRLGYGYRGEEKQEYASIGAGLDLPKFRVNYGYQAVFKGEPDSLHLIDLGIPF